MTQLLNNIRPYQFLSFFGIALLFMGCDPKSNSQQPQKLDLSCVKLFDESGQSNGTYGGCTQSPDWGAITLTSTERSFLTFADTVSLVGTVSANITEFLIAPNPVIRNGALSFMVRSATTGQPVKLKLAIIDEDLNILGQYSLRVKTNQINAIQINESTYAPGKFYRVYYRASSQGDSNLFEGFGNILVCKQQVINGDIDGDCF